MCRGGGRRHLILHAQLIGVKECHKQKEIRPISKEYP